jgi:hypothetical protein
VTKRRRFRYDTFANVIPCAVQREAVRRRHGIFAGMPVLQDPVSAQQHFML